MSRMNFKDWPVATMCEFEEVIVDATKWNDGFYSASFNFFKEYSDDGNAGFTLCSHVIAPTLRELYLKVTGVIELGMFDGSNVQAHGGLYDEDHNELAMICWHQYSDSEWDAEDDDTQGLTFADEHERVKVGLTHPAPTMIQ